MGFFRPSAFGAASLAALASLVLSGCGQGGPQAEPEPEALTASAAGGRYLDAVCPVDAAWGRADVELDRLRLALSRGSDPDAGPISRALREVAASSEHGADVLDPAERTWPAEVRAPIAAVRETLLADVPQAERLAGLEAPEIVSYRWAGTDEISESAARARKGLGLPGDAESACAQWEEQRQPPAGLRDGTAADPEERGETGDD